MDSFESGMTRADAELMLRSFLLKMSNVDAQLGNLKEGLLIPLPYTDSADLG